MTATELLARYFPVPPTILRHIPLSRGDDDFRKVYLVEGDHYTRVRTLLAYLHRQMTRDDLRL